MEDAKLSRLRDWVEPAHPSVIRFYDEFREFYRVLRERYQTRIDDTFDRVAQQTGLVLATTLPVTFEVAEKGRLKGVGLAIEQLRESLFGKEFAGLFGDMIKDDPVPITTPGRHVLYVFWFDALKLKLHTDWMEPVHHRWELECKEWELVPGPSRDWLEPVHTAPFTRRCKRWGLKAPYWLDWLEPVHLTPGWEEVAGPFPEPWRQKVTLLAIDEVYPELRLGERLSQRQALLRQWVMPEVMEPAHFRDLRRTTFEQLLKEVIAVLRERGY